MFDEWNMKSVISLSTESSDEPLEKDEYPEKEAPKDKYWIVYLIILINGIGVLLPWNMFITIAPDYYVNYWFTIDNKETSYGKSFMSALGISAQIPNFIISIINVTQIIGGSMMIRIAGPLAVNCINIVIILALVIFQQPTSDAMHWFYIVSLTIVMVMNASNGLYQNSIFGLAADFPAKYTNALVVGNNICGTFTSVISIITIIAFNNPETVALLYFSISLAVLILCSISLWYIRKLEFYKFYTQKGSRARHASNSSRPSLKQFWETFKNCWPQLVSIFLVYFVTLSVFPTILVGIQPYSTDGKTWTSVFPKKTYAEITTFLNFNLFAAIGSTAASFIQFPNPQLLPVPVVLRLLFIPFFMLCNYDPVDRHMPVWFRNEWFFIIGNTVMAFSSGYLSSLGMMYAPRVVPSSMSKTAGMAAALALVAGILCGVAFTPMITTIVENIY